MTNQFTGLRTSSPNIPVINCLRGIAASMVCFFHFSSIVNYINNDTIKYILSYGATGVYMFFVISGIVIPLSMIKGGYTINNWGNFMLKRLARLEPPYLASLILALCYFKFRMIISPSTEADVMPSVKNVISHIGYLVPFTGGKWVIPAYWTLCIEFQYYIVLSLLLPMVINGNKISRYFFYLIFLGTPFLLPQESLFPVYAPVFLIGILYTFSLVGMIESKEFSLVLLLCIGVSLLVLPPIDTIMGLLTLLIIHFIPSFTTKALEFLGKISYSLYLLHTITGTAVINILSHRFREPFQKPIVIITGYSVAVICSYIFYVIIEKNSQKLSSRIKYHKHSPAVSLVAIQENDKEIKSQLS